MGDEDTVVRNADTIRDVLKSACKRNEIAILVTPYAKFETNFLWLDLDFFHLAATMSKEDALFALRSPDLRLRFPYGHHIFRAATVLAGVGIAQGRNSIRMRIPTVLESDDFRRAFRVEKVGRVPVAFSSRKYDLLTGNLVNISTGGARLYSSRDFEPDEILLEDLIHVTISLTPEITINTKGKVRHVKDRSVGLEFRPQLDGKLLDDLSRWAFQKREDSVAHFAGQEQQEASPAPCGPVAPIAGAGGAPVIALVGGTPELEQQLQTLLAGLPPVRRFPANVQTMASLAASPNTLALFYLESTAHDCRKRARLLLEPLQGKVPFVLVGTSIEAAMLTELANEWKGVMGCAISPSGNLLFPRMVAGIFRKWFNL